MIGIVGKLPAHGDFVRRGGPPALLAEIDRWLDTELSRAMAGADPDGLDGWRFALAGDLGLVLGTIVSSRDKVGRVFPLVGTTRSDGPIDFTGSERWCAAAGDILAQARDGVLRADDALAALADVPPPASGDNEITGGWWRAGDAAAVGEAGLPTGPAFERLLGNAA